MIMIKWLVTLHLNIIYLTKVGFPVHPQSKALPLKPRAQASEQMRLSEFLMEKKLLKLDLTDYAHVSC